MSKPTRTSIIIREGRKRAGLTQQELADKLGITTGAVSNYENGVSFPKAEVAFRTLRHPRYNTLANYFEASEIENARRPS